VDVQLQEEIQQICDILRSGAYDSEAAVSRGVVFRLLQAVGWPVFDPRIVHPEHDLGGRRVDYALCHPPGRPVALIEVKRGEQIEGADRQLFEYAFHAGIQLAILTNGQEWHFYVPGETGSYTERRVYALDLLSRSAGEAGERLIRYLGYERSCSGAALQSAKEDYRDAARRREIRATLPQAWSKLIEEQNDLLMELVQEKVESLCGYKPDKETVASFLTEGRFSTTPPHLVAAAARPEPMSTVAQRPAPARETEPAAARGFVLHDREFLANTNRDVMLKLLEELARSDSGFLERFAARPKHGRSRRYVARTREELYPDSPHLTEQHSRQVNGWWVGTNYSTAVIRSIIQMACEVAGLTYGRDLTVRLG
jgi:predicted type IV restriction endonuclease